MSNSKNNEEKTSSKSSFNKSKSISSAMDDLEMGRPISKAVPDLEMDISTLSSDLEEESSSISDLEIVPKVEEDSETKSNYDELSSFLDEDDELESQNIGDEIEELRDENEDVEDKLEESNTEDENIFVYPSEESDDLDIVDEINVDDFTFTKKGKEFYSLLDEEDLILSRPAKKSDDSSSFSDKFSKSTKKSGKSFNKFKFSSIKNKFGILEGEKLSTKSKIIALLGLIIGIVLIIYGIMNFSNVSDRVIDHVLLGEAGSWSIILILLGLVIILFDAFYVFYYKNSLGNSNIKNAQIRSTFDTIDKIKNIDGDYYKNESGDSDSLFSNILKIDKEESSKVNINNSIFKDEEIHVDHVAHELDELDVVDESDEMGDLDYVDVSDSYDEGFIDVENPIFEDESEKLSNHIGDDFVIVPEVEEDSETKSNYDDLSSFLDEDDEEELELEKNAEIDSVIVPEVEEDSKPKSTQKEDLAAKKARIIEGTNFDNSLRKSKK